MYYIDNQLIDPIANRENENRQPYAKNMVSNTSLQSPLGPSLLPVSATQQQPLSISTGHSTGIGLLNLDMGRKQQPFEFNSEHIQCLCEALQQKGDVEKLATFLWSLPTTELLRSNESVLR